MLRLINFTSAFKYVQTDLTLSYSTYENGKSCRMIHFATIWRKTVWSYFLACSFASALSTIWRTSPVVALRLHFSRCRLITLVPLLWESCAYSILQCLHCAFSEPSFFVTTTKSCHTGEYCLLCFWAGDFPLSWSPDSSSESAVFCFFFCGFPLPPWWPFPSCFFLSCTLDDIPLPLSSSAWTCCFFLLFR